MRSLKRNSYIGFLIIWGLAGCATSSYRVLHQGDYTTELQVSPDRVLLECEWLYDADDPTLYGFMIHVLDEEDTVITLVQGNTLDKESCDERLKKIGRILGEGKDIYLAGKGVFDGPREKARSYVFPNKGIFYGNKRVLGFMAVANEFGACYDAYSGDEKPCPREPFPTKNFK